MKSYSALRVIRLAFSFLICAFAASVRAELRVGYGVGEITPPPGSPSAGYGDRMGRPMKGVHDPLLSTAVVIDNGEKKLAFCGVDHLGMLYGMIQEIKQGVAADPSMANCEVFVGSSHTHGGGGGFMDFPGIGFVLAGKFSKESRQLYIDGSIKAILAAGKNLQPAKIGIGYGHAPGLNGFRSSWPPHVQTQDDVAVIKMTKLDGSPLAVLFNFAAHPTVLSGRNMEFSADFVGYARTRSEEAIGGGVKSVYFQGAQADVSPHAPKAEGDDFARCDAMGKALAAVVKQVWDSTTATESLSIKTLKEEYTMAAQANSAGMKVPMPLATTEINLIVFNDVHAFIAIPGELSTIYDFQLKRFGGYLGYEHVSILGLTNDAHGYIITPEAWRHHTYESTVSFGGEVYGELVKNKAQAMLDLFVPKLPADEPPPIKASVLQGAGK